MLTKHCTVVFSLYVIRDQNKVKTIYETCITLKSELAYKSPRHFTKKLKISIF